MPALPTKPPPPEWVTSDARPIKGLDLLGLRIPVERVGHTLLEAVTTISPTIRYISLRAWIARRYALARLPDSWKSFREFSGRIEAAVAIGNLLLDRNTTGLVGPREGQVKIDAGTDPIKLETLVKQLAVSAYAGPSDAFKLSFSDERSEVPGLTAERGLALFESVEKSVKNTVFAKKMVSDPHAGVFSREALREFGAAFPIGRPDGEERQVLISCLFPKNTPAGGPSMTYRLLLELARAKQRPPKPDDVFETAVRPDRALIGGAFGGCVDGWMWYLVRDMIAACHEALLQSVVDALSMGTGQPEHADSVLQKLLTQDGELEQPLRDLDLFPAGKAPLDNPLRLLADLVRRATTPKSGELPRWGGKLQETGVVRSALSAGPGSAVVLPVAWLLVQERIGDLSQVPRRIQELLSYQGLWRMGICGVILPGLKDMLRRDITIRDAAHELTVRTVSHHLNVSWGRLRSDPRRDVSVICADGNRWSPHNSFRAGRTASRLPQAIGWLIQLGLIDENGCTTDGSEILNDAVSPRIVGVGT